MTDKEELKKQIEDWIVKERNEYINDVINSISIPSVAKKEDGKYPFGKECANMLDYMKTVTDKYGFDYQNHEYYLATSLIKGTERKGEIGLLGHTDVVPPGEGWATDPYKGYEKNGYIVGRGSNDNKGSVFSCIYAMRFLKEHNIKTKNDVRLMFGSSEEIGMDDLKYYVSHYNVPNYTLVADSWFPVSRSEKGRFIMKFECMNSDGNYDLLNCPGAGNSVPNKCQINLTGHTIEEICKLAKNRKDLVISKNTNSVNILALGVSKHSAFPEGSVNAIRILADFLIDNNLLEGEIKKTFSFIKNTLSDYKGVALGIYTNDDFAGYTTHVLTNIQLIDGKTIIELSVGVPAIRELDIDAMHKKVIDYFSKSELKIDLVQEKIWNPHFVDVNNPIVDILCEDASFVYQRKMEPFAMAGGTYTWVTPNSFAAGPAVFGDEQSLFTEPGHGFPHQPDECASIDTWMKGIEVYIFALLDIDKWLSNSLKTNKN